MYNLFYRDFISLDHTVISPYGELFGNTISPVVTFGGVPEIHVDTAEMLIGATMALSLNSLWIVEGYSDCTLMVTDEFGENHHWEVDTRKKFETGMMDAEVPNSLYNIAQYQHVTIFTKGFTMTVPGNTLLIIETNKEWAMNTMNTNYVDMCTTYFQQKIVDSLSTIEGALPDDVVVELKEPFPLDDTGVMFYRSVCNIVMIGDHGNGNFIRGCSALVETINSYEHLNISENMTGSVYVDSALINSEVPNVAEIAEVFGIQWFPAIFNEMTNRTLKVKPIDARPTIGAIMEDVQISPLCREVSISSGTRHGVKRFN